MKKILAIISASLAIIFAVMGVISVVTLHNNAYFSPDYEKIDLVPILNKEVFTDDDYKTLFYQTGLGKYAIDSIRNDYNFVARVKEFQDQFFKKNNTNCVREAITTNMEYNVTKSGYPTSGFKMFDVKPGYVLIMESSHSFGWRHGHAGIVLTKYTTVEAPIIGQPSMVYGIDTWTCYPSFIMLRLKDADDDKLKEIANGAKNNLVGIIYSPLAGVFNKKTGPRPETVQCAHLVWQAFYNFGIDIDSDGGNIVTVNDIKNSDKFEIVQIYGYDPSEFMG
jgi:uncharacterized protein YycO